MNSPAQARREMLKRILAAQAVGEGREAAEDVAATLEEQARVLDDQATLLRRAAEMVRRLVQPALSQGGVA